MDKDIFVSSNNQQKSTKPGEISNNFFLHENISFTENAYLNPVKRLNDYDADILENDAYKKIEDEVFKLEYKISQTELSIKKISNEIIAAKDIGDYELAGTLSGRKLLLEEELEEVTKIYNSKSFSARISDGFIGNVKNKIEKVKNKFYEFGKNLFSRLPKKFSSFIEIKDSLKTLETINESVDELMSRQIPYGESLNRYNQLSMYITRANTLQTQISKHIK